MTEPEFDETTPDTDPEPGPITEREPDTVRLPQAS